MEKAVSISNKFRIKPDLPAGFRDYGPADAIAKQAMIDVIRTTFERFGFDPLETSSVQRTEVLTGGEEDSGKIIFNVKGSQEEESDLPAVASAKEGSSLRFDLTVPLARFMAANPDLPKPFKRYQIGTVWRGERPQAGRYREFLQADVDIVGSSSIDADAEIAMIIYTVFKNLGVNDFLIKINNRKLYNALPKLCGFPEETLWEVLRIIDKLDKIGMDKMENELEKIIEKEQAVSIRELLEQFQQSRDITSITLNGKPLAKEGSEELYRINELLEAMGMKRGINWNFDISIVRGLSYYTGSVFEVTLPYAPEVGSVCGGGRYDELVAQFTGQNIPAVGVSFGVDRLFAAMEKLGVLRKKQTLTQVLILQLDANLRNDYLTMAQELRNAGINTALYLGDNQMFQAQLAYAVKKEIPYMMIYGANEAKQNIVAIKNLATREQAEMPRNELVGYFKKFFLSP